MPFQSLGYLLPAGADVGYAFQKPIAVTNPAAGTEFSRTTPGEFYEIAMTVTCALVTSATVVTRSVVLQLRNENGRTIDNIDGLLTAPASTTVNYRWSVTLTTAYAIGTTICNMPLFPEVLVPGYSVRIGVSNLQAGDQLASIALVLQAYWTGPVGEDTPTVLATSSPLSSQELEAVSAAPATTGAHAATAPAQSGPQQSAASGSTSASGSSTTTTTQSAPPPPTVTPIPSAHPILEAGME